MHNPIADKEHAGEQNRKIEQLRGLAVNSPFHITALLERGYSKIGGIIEIARNHLIVEGTKTQVHGHVISVDGGEHDRGDHGDYA